MLTPIGGIPHPRHTDDAGLVVKLRAGNYSQAARALQGLGTNDASRWIIGPLSTGSSGDPS